MWLPLSWSLNMVNRSMGHDDLYPFVLPAAVLDKMGFIHTVIDEVTRTGKPPALVRVEVGCPRDAVDVASAVDEQCVPGQVPAAFAGQKHRDRRDVFVRVAEAAIGWPHRPSPPAAGIARWPERTLGLRRRQIALTVTPVGAIPARRAGSGREALLWRRCIPVFPCGR
ncbi:hypothetical protein I553_10227 [Mycobacterium xenopi 4042]|uniref:Uncharacterized protein n=1 Tax=Mycobacterium xenopi 4042 TaxID=1299334 RepID=X7ZHR1_MYCXE|nr:hypothetical protein I553_10227 [Mycobacterium xenopi 4042]